MTAGIVPSTTPKDLPLIANVLAPWQHRLRRVALFGSRATGEARANSDYDLVLYGDLVQTDVDRICTDFSESALCVTADVIAYDLLRHAPLKAHIDRVATDLPLPWLPTTTGQP